jgi:hypothetical protein
MKQFATPILIVGTLMSVPSISLAQGQAIVVRSTELKAKPFSDAETLKSLKENQKLDVVSRKASWTQVKAQDALGWVKMLSLRFEDQGTTSFSLKETFASGVSLQKGTNTGSTTTTAVKGLTPESFKNLSPNLNSFQKMQNFSVEKSVAKNFASQQNLVDQELAYVKAEGER